MTSKLKCGRPHLPSASPLQKSELRQVLLDAKDKLRIYVESNQLKNSEQRWKIAQLVLESQRHLTAQQIVGLAEAAYPEMGAATVYRSLKILCDAKILRASLEDYEGRTLFESYEDDHHDHVICVDCGHIFEFHNEEIESQQTKVLKAQKFREVRHRHVIYAHCDYLK